MTLSRLSHVSGRRATTHASGDLLKGVVDLADLGGLDVDAAVVLAHLVGESLREPPGCCLQSWVRLATFQAKLKPLLPFL